MRVLICGDRNWDDPAPINWLVRGLSEECQAWDNPLTVINGAARGADTLGMKAAEAYEVSHVEFPALWTVEGKAAGVIRNQRMLDEGMPDVVFAFHDSLDKSKGTADMVRRAKKARLPTYVVSHA